MPTRNTLHAVDFLEGAISYRAAANKLRETMPYSGITLGYPVYFLYHHAVELALKACLLSHGAKIPTGPDGHDISASFDACRAKGFLKLKNDELSPRPLIAFLSAGTDGIKYRYPKEESRHGLPHLTWVDEVTGRLIEAISPDVSIWAKKNNVSRPSIPRMVIGGRRF